VSPPWIDNALWAGEAIVARLKAEVPGLGEVLCIDQFDPKASEPRAFPAAVVLLASLRVTTPASGLRQVAGVEQDWLVVLAVRSAARDPNANAAEFGPLIPATVAALMGWKPDGSDYGFAWKTGPRPDYGKDVSYFPLLFSLQMAAVRAPA
jgi:hypothetical protein